jgi:hypothetical protein
MSNLKDELEQERREKEWAETWRPEAPGEMLIGTLEGYDQATTDFGTYRVAHIRDEEGVLRGLWLMHSVLQDEWKEAAPDGEPQVGDRVGVQYLGQRSGENFDYHMWTVKVDRSETAATEGDDGEDGTAGAEATANRQPQKRSGGRKGGKREAGSEAPGGDPKDFDGSDLWGEPALDTESREEAPQESSGSAGDPEGESTLDDPNGGLPF